MRYRAVVAAVISTAVVAGAVTRADRTLSIRSRLPEGYRVEPMIWRGVIDEGGPEVSFNGTIEEVTQQIQAVKRDFTWESLRRDLVDTTTPLEKRSKTKTICGVGGEDVGHGPLTPNVEDLRDKIAKMAGTCAVAGGPRVCTVLTCTNNAAVWLCNDNTWAISPTCSYLATYVTDIVGTCCQDYYHGHRFCRGQEFDSDNYNVIVGWKRSC